MYTKDSMAMNGPVRVSIRSGKLPVLGRAKQQRQHASNDQVTNANIEKVVPGGHVILAAAKCHPGDGLSLWSESLAFPGGCLDGEWTEEKEQKHKAVRARSIAMGRRVQRGCVCCRWYVSQQQKQAREAAQKADGSRCRCEKGCRSEEWAVGLIWKLCQLSDRACAAKCRKAVALAGWGGINHEHRR